MTVTPGWTAEEIREFVFEYDRQPHGTKQAWLAGTVVSPWQLRKWQHTVFGGDLERGLAPRQAVGVSPASRRRAAAARSAAQAEVEALRARVAELEAANGSLERANDALGKAIGLLQAMSVHGPDTNPTTNDPSSS